MKIGQPKLSERKIQRNGMFIPSTSHCGEPYSRTEDYELKESVGEASRCTRCWAALCLGFESGMRNVISVFRDDSLCKNSAHEFLSRAGNEAEHE